MRRVTTLAAAFVLCPLLSACLKKSSTGWPGPFFYYHELKGYVAALDYSTEHAPRESLLIAYEIQQSLANAVCEDVSGYEDDIVQMTVLTNEIVRLYLEYAGADETNFKIAELVAIAGTLPGEEQDYRAWWEFPEGGENSNGVDGLHSDEDA